MIKWSKFATKAKFYASRGASKMGLGADKRFKLSMKYQKAKKKLSNKAFDIKKGAKKIKSGATLPAVGFGLGAAGGFGTAGAVTYLMGYNRGKKKKNGK
jgi:hypothetical protein